MSSLLKLGADLGDEKFDAFAVDIPEVSKDIVLKICMEMINTFKDEDISMFFKHDRAHKILDRDAAKDMVNKMGYIYEFDALEYKFSVDLLNSIVRVKFDDENMILST